MTETFKRRPVSGEEVSAWIRSKGGEKTYFAPLDAVSFEGERWRVDVNAPKLLHDLFVELSGAREGYRKTTHSVWLTEWLLEHEPGALNEVAEHLQSILKAGTG